MGAVAITSGSLLGVDRHGRQRFFQWGIGRRGTVVGIVVEVHDIEDLVDVFLREKRGKKQKRAETRRVLNALFLTLLCTEQYCRQDAGPVETAARPK